MKSKIMIETFGANLYRLTLPVNACEQDRIAFANLRWIADGNREDTDGQTIETFCVSRSRLRKVNRAFRIALTGLAWHEKEIVENWLCLPPRKRNVFAKSGFRFSKVDQRSSYGLDLEPHKTGNNELDNATDNPWNNYPSQAEKLFDKIN